MNKARLRQEFTVSGSFVMDAVYGVMLAPLWYLIAVVFFSF